MSLHVPSCVLLEGHNMKHEREIECTFHT